MLVEDEIDYDEHSCSETSSCYENGAGESIVTRAVLDSEDLRRLRAKKLDCVPADAVVALHWE